MKNLQILAVAVGLALVGCSDSGDTPTGPVGGNGNGDISFSADIAPLIVGNSCLRSGCHGGGSSSGGLSLGAASYTDIENGTGNNGAIVVVGDASTSNLYLKLTASPPFGSRMPLGSASLSTTSLDKIKDWINQGAKDN